MAQKDIKNLTSTELKKQNKVLDEQRAFNVTVGDTVYKLSHDIKFRQSKKNALLDDMVAFFQEATKNIEILELSTPYVTLLVLKHFTSLEVSENVDEALELLNVLVDLGLLNQIVVELPEDQLAEVFEMVTKAVTAMSDNLADAQEEIEKLNEQVENDVVKEMIPDVN
jgi:spermidine/putrescine-binding protein